MHKGARCRPRNPSRDLRREGEERLPSPEAQRECSAPLVEDGLKLPKHLALESRAYMPSCGGLRLMWSSIPSREHSGVQDLSMAVQVGLAGFGLHRASSSTVSS